MGEHCECGTRCLGQIQKSDGGYALFCCSYLSFFLGYFHEQKATGKKKKATGNKPVKDKSFESPLAPFFGLPADLAVPILDDVINGTISLQVAHTAAYAAKAEARMAEYVDEMLPALCHSFSQTTYYKDLLQDEKKKQLMLEFKCMFIFTVLSFNFCFSNMAKTFSSQ
jgi:hypothetical protein